MNLEADGELRKHLGPDEPHQKVRNQLRSNLFDTQILYMQKKSYGNKTILANLERKHAMGKG